MLRAHPVPADFSGSDEKPGQRVVRRDLQGEWLGTRKARQGVFDGADAGPVDAGCDDFDEVGSDDGRSSPFNCNAHRSLLSLPARRRTILVSWHGTLVIRS